MCHWHEISKSQSLPIFPHLRESISQTVSSSSPTDISSKIKIFIDKWDKRCLPNQCSFLWIRDIKNIKQRWNTRLYLLCGKFRFTIKLHKGTSVHPDILIFARRVWIPRKSTWYSGIPCQSASYPSPAHATFVTWNCHLVSQRVRKSHPTSCFADLCDMDWT